MLDSDFRIHTLNTRDNVFFDVLLELTGTDVRHMRAESVSLARTTVAVLARKGIEYAELKNVLVPSTKRHEVGLFFAPNAIPNGWYGRDVFDKVLPLLQPKSSHSVLAGDLIVRDGLEDVLRIELQRKLHRATGRAVDNSTDYFIVYINYLSDAMIARLHEGLLPYPGYVGWIDFSYQSHFKAYVSQTLPVAFVKHRNVVLVPHPDDLPNQEDENTPGFPFEKYGLTVRSVQTLYYSLFLSYKIERPVFIGHDTDVQFALGAIHPEPNDLVGLPVTIDADKIAYLWRHKRGSVKRLGVVEEDVTALQQLIRAKLGENYIYNLRYRHDYRLSQFDIIIEHSPSEMKQPVRAMAALQYQGREAGVRLITLY